MAKNNDTQQKSRDYSTRERLKSLAPQVLHGADTLSSTLLQLGEEGVHSPSEYRTAKTLFLTLKMAIHLAEQDMDWQIEDDEKQSLQKHWAL